VKTRRVQRLFKGRKPKALFGNASKKERQEYKSLKGQKRKKKPLRQKRKKKKVNPNVVVRNTSKYGKALFASADIKKGSLVFDYSGCREIHAGKVSDIPNEPPEFIRDHTLQIGEHRFLFVDKGKLGRFFAHSCEPNCGFLGNTKIVAMRDIKKGEELTFDYEMSEESDWRIKCLCGSKNCRKTIGSFRNLPEQKIRQYGKFIAYWLRKKYGLA